LGKILKVLNSKAMKRITQTSKTNQAKGLSVQTLEKVLEDKFGSFEKSLSKKMDRKIDDRFKEQTQIILEAVNVIVKKNIEDSERRMLAYTELRTQEILDVFKDDREENIKNFSEHNKRITAVESKVKVLEKQI
jgi:hypothetical protein